MIFKDIDIHGCSEVEHLENGAYGTLRVPLRVDEALFPKGKLRTRDCTGLEFRFVLKGDSVILKFACNPGERSEVTVYHGEFVADWPETTKILSGECEIKIIQSNNIDTLRTIAKKHGHRFSPDVIRLVFEGARPQLVDVIGDIEVPCEDMYPKLKYLAYGSSITHGSISLHPYYNYVERVAANLSADVTNLGYAGTACLEREMADFIADSTEFDFATIEMGINILGITTEDYESRVRYFVKRIAEAHPDSKIFAIDIYYCKNDICGDGKAEQFRNILKKVTQELNLPNVIYVNGKTVLTSPAKLSSGLVHPNPDGIMEMTENLTKIIKDHL